MSIVKKEFVRRILQDEATRFEKNQGLQMKKLLQFHTGELHDSREFVVEGGTGMDGKLTITHKSYQRYLDIKRKSRNKKTNKVSKKSYPIHNRYAFGHLYSIANRLMFDLTDDVVAGIKKDLQIK